MGAMEEGERLKIAASILFSQFAGKWTVLIKRRATRDHEIEKGSWLSSTDFKIFPFANLSLFEYFLFLSLFFSSSLFPVFFDSFEFYLFR